MTTEKRTLRIKVVSLNIWMGQLLDEVCSFLEEENPDIVVLQEVFDAKDPMLPAQFRALEILQQRLKLPYHDYEAALLNNFPEGGIPEGNATFSRFPIIAREVFPYDGSFSTDYVDSIENAPTFPHVILCNQLQTPAGEVTILNVHGPWDLTGERYSERRGKMRDTILAATKNKPNSIVAGDTNAKPVNRAITDIEQHLVSVFGHELTTTFNMRHKTNPGYATAAVDMAFVSPDVRVIEKSCPDVDISDHLPLVMTLEITNQSKEEVVS